MQDASGLPRLEPGATIIPEEPKKKINDGEDLAFFLTSKAHGDIMRFLTQLNRAMIPRLEQDGQTTAWPSQSAHIRLSPQVMRIKVLLQTLGTLVERTPPETGPRRFGNVAFRSWYRKVEDGLMELLQQALPEQVWKHVAPDRQTLLKQELGGYLLGSFGNPERLDYGTGHELCFLVFLGGLWKLNGFAICPSGDEERGILVGIFKPYLELVRNLILTYSLEPAGSHGVWGLDDHSFLPYIFGSAQLSRPVTQGEATPTEGSLSDAPKPTIVTNERAIRLLSSQNMYFDAIAFIYDVKKGPFWEHSPTLYDISGIESGWGKINKGLIKMYNAEVLSKFPVVQHLRFGSLFVWEQDPHAAPVTPTVHASSQPVPATDATRVPISDPPAETTTAVPPRRPAMGHTAAPWVRSIQNSSLARSTAEVRGAGTTASNHERLLQSLRTPRPS